MDLEYLFKNLNTVNYWPRCDAEIIRDFLKRNLWSQSDYFCATIFFISCLLCDLLLRFFTSQLTEIIKTLILLLIWRCYSETRGLYTATLAASSSSSIMDRAEA